MEGALAWFRDLVRPFGNRRFLLHIFGLPLLTATLIFTAFHLASDRQLFAKLADDALERRMALFAGTIAPSPHARPFVLVDFDDDASRRYGDPVLVPPAVLGRALRRLAQNRPWAVVVSIDFADVATPAELADIAEGLRSLSQQGAMVLLVRETLPPTRPGGLRRLRATELDPLVTDLAGVAWATETYPRSDDGVIRELDPFVAVERGGETIALPSVSLALAILARHTTAANAEDALDSAYAERGDTEDAVLIETPGGDLRIDPRPARIAYSLSWPPLVDEQYRVRSGGSVHPLTQRVPMLPLLGDRPMPREKFNGVAVFLESTANGRSSVQTPLGAMPGAFVLINASRAWIEFGMPGRDRFWLGLVALLIYFAWISLVCHLVLHAVHTLIRDPWRTRIESQLPTLLSAVIWLTFYTVGGTALSLGLAATSYLVILSITFAHGRIRAQTRAETHRGKNSQEAEVAS